MILKNRISGCIYGLSTILILYCFIFNPPFPFVPFGIPKIFSLLAFPFFLLPLVRRRYWENYKGVTILLVLMILYAYVVLALSSSDSMFAIRLVLMFFESFLTAYVLAFFLLRRYREKADMLILWTTFLASVISTFLISDPDFNIIVRNYFNLLQENRLRDIIAFRGFGIADDLLFTYAITLSIGACICLQYARKQKIYYLFLVFFLFGIFFNARIGLVPLLLYLTYLVIWENRFKQISLIALTCIFIFYTLSFTGFLEEYEHTINWIVQGGNEISSLITSNDVSKVEGNLGTLFGEMIVVPDTFWGIIFGTGKDIFLDRNNSDIGYILQLNYGGVVYVLFFISIVLSLYIKGKKSITIENQWFCFVLIGTFLICNIKGHFFSTLSGIRMLMLLFFVYTLSPTILKDK